MLLLNLYIFIIGVLAPIFTVSFLQPFFAYFYFALFNGSSHILSFEKVLRTFFSYFLSIKVLDKKYVQKKKLLAEKL